MTTNISRERLLFGGTSPVYTDARLRDARQAMLGGKTPANFAIIKDGFDRLSERLGSDNVVRVADLMTSDYQRHSEPDEQRTAITAVAKIARTFNPKALGIATVGQRDGKLFALDGVHRAILARMADVEWMPALIEPVADEREEATLFSILNVGRKAVSSYSRSRSMSLIDGESMDRRLADLLGEHQMRVVQSDIGGPAMAKRMIKWMGESGFGEGIAIHDLCWPGLAAKPEVAGAFGWLAVTYGLGSDDAGVGGSTTAELVTGVQDLADNPNHLLNAVPVEGPGHKHGETRVQAITQHLIKMLNKGKKGKARLDPKLLPWSEESQKAARAAKLAERAEARAAKSKPVPKTVAAEAMKAAKEIATWEPGPTIAELRANEDRPVVITLTDKGRESEIRDDLTQIAGRIAAGH